GSNHLAHLLRRNLNIKVLLFNNRIYGLTKGQYSPTSERGKKTKSSPFGSPDEPVNPLLFALGCKATFVARSSAVNGSHLHEVLLEAYRHKGTAFLEILQNCNVFNDKAFDEFDAREKRDEHEVFLLEGRPIVFGRDKDKGISFADGNMKITEDPSLASIHDPSNLAYACHLATAAFPDFPIPMGVFYKEQRRVYEDELKETLAKVSSRSIEDLFLSGEWWEI
ncbi:MAG: 2-oxoacid:ferredoxin oxidoreductase subunit beta, partial [Candidatus Dadabacteria bacterium]